MANHTNSQDLFIEHADNVVVGDLVDEIVEHLAAARKAIRVIIDDSRLRTRLLDHEHANLCEISLDIKDNLKYVRERRSSRIKRKAQRSRRLLGR